MNFKKNKNSFVNKNEKFRYSERKKKEFIQFVYFEFRQIIIYFFIKIFNLKKSKQIFITVFVKLQ